MERKVAKLGFASLHEYFADKIAKEAKGIRRGSKSAKLHLKKAKSEDLRKKAGWFL